jgi:tRNA A-37 threonylcarbamoyl transferase component Bud32
MATARVLNDRYEMGRPLGKGGMAHVYRGTDRILDRTVAIKVLAGKYAGDERSVARFRREAQAAAGLNHANIVGVYDTGDEGRMHYIVMEYVEGETLGDVLRRDGRLDAHHAAAIAAEVATALQAAHDSGLVHRDVKPGNVMIDRDGRVKVVDFGIARAAADDTLTQTGLVLGTASYLSPEQAQGLTVDARSDVYSLGCVLYQMLTGRPPFEGETPVSIAFKHVNETPIPPRDIDRSIPPHLDQAVMRATEKDPDARFPSAEAFRAAVAGEGTVTIPLAAAAGGDTDVLPATAPAEATPPPGRRGRSWLPVALVAVAVLAVIGVIAATSGEPEPPGGRADRGGGGQARPSPEAEIPSVPVALAALEDLVIDLFETDQITEDLGRQILDEGRKAQDGYSGGDLEKAIEHLEHAHADVDAGLAEGRAASPQVAETLHGALDVVAGAMEAAPPPADTPDEEAPAVDENEGDGGDEGPGNSENAPGQQKKDDEGNGENDD